MNHRIPRTMDSTPPKVCITQIHYNPNCKGYIPMKTLLQYDEGRTISCIGDDTAHTYTKRTAHTDTDEAVAGTWLATHRPRRRGEWNYQLRQANHQRRHRHVLSSSKTIFHPLCSLLYGLSSPPSASCYLNLLWYSADFLPRCNIYGPISHQCIEIWYN